MPTIYALKPAFQTVLRPAVAWLAAVGVTANQVTIAAIALSVGWGTVIAAATGAAFALLGLPLVLVVRMALNAIDGMLAREHGQASPLGFFLNETGDVASDAALYLPLMLVLAPAASSAFFGSVNSDCSKPSATRMATAHPSSSCAIFEFLLLS